MIRKRRHRRFHSYEDHNHYPWVPFMVLFISLLLCLLSYTIITQTVQSYSVTEANHHKQKQKIMTQSIEGQIEVKRKMINDLILAFRKNNLQLHLDEKSGDITVDGGILFASNSYTVSDTGKKYLENFFPAYIGVLLSEPFKNEVSAIVIEGHADSAGSYPYNLDLSQARASSVVQLVYSKEFPDFPQKEESKKLITTKGQSYNNPVFVKGTHTIDATKSRRVVFKFRLKDEESIKILNEVLGKTS